MAVITTALAEPRPVAHNVPTRSRTLDFGSAEIYPAIRFVSRSVVFDVKLVFDAAGTEYTRQV